MGCRLPALVGVWMLALGCSTSRRAPVEPVALQKQVQALLVHDLEIRLLEPGVWLINHTRPWPANSLVVEMETGDLVLVDTPYTPAATHQLLDWLEQTLGKRQMTAVNTHFHWDALGGNEALLTRGVAVHGSDATVALLREREDSMRAQVLGWLAKRPLDAQPFRALQAVPPVEIFPLERGLTLGFGDETVDVVYPGHAHSPDGVVVYFPHRKLLFGGCAVVDGERLGNKSDADLDAWVLALERMKEFDVRAVVPGHGTITSTGLLQRTIDLLNSSR